MEGGKTDAAGGLGASKGKSIDSTVPLYSTLDLDAVLVEAEKRTLLERQRFDPLMAVIEKNAQNNQLILEAPSLEVLMEHKKLEKSRASYQMQFLISGDLEQAGKIARMVAREFHTMGVRNVFVEEMDERFVLSVEMRQLATYAPFPTVKDMSLARIAQPVDYPAQFVKGSILALPTLLLMVRVYRDLHSPSEADRWGELLGYAGNFAKQINQLSKEMKASIKGGSAKIIDPKERRRIIESLMEVPEFIHVGRAALKSGVPSRLQVLANIARKPTEVTGAQIEKRIGQFVEEKVGGIVSDLPTTLIWQRPRLPTDSRLARLTVYLIRPDGSRDPIMDVFNILAFDLVPVKGSVAHGYVLCRLLLADIWTVLVVTRMKLLAAGLARERLDEHFSLLEMAIENAREFDAVKATYVGTYEPDVLARKRAIQAAGRRQYKPIYNPGR